MKDDVQKVQAYYEENVDKEWMRIAGRAEFLLTCRMLDRYIKPGDRVLDIGGGPGRYSLYLAAKGCEVVLLDLAEGNTNFAAQKAEEIGLDLETITGDARQVQELTTGTYDHILLMGPMYHLLKESDRVLALKSAMSLLKVEGVIYVAFLNLLAGIIYSLRSAPETIILESEHEYLKAVRGNYNYAGDAFTEAFFINYAEIKPFMAQFPLETLHLFSQEGIIAMVEKEILSQPEAVKASWLNLCEELWEREEFLSWSEHLMYIGRKK